METEEQFRFLAGEGCDAVQGYLFARPLSPSQIKTYLLRGDRVPGVKSAVTAAAAMRVIG